MTKARSDDAPRIGLVRMQSYGPRMLEGPGLTLKIVFLSVALGAVLALPLAAARMSTTRWISRAAYAYTYLFRGTPLLAQTFLVYYVSTPTQN